MDVRNSLFSFLFILFWSWSRSSSAASVKPLTVVLRSSWDYTPLLLETSEFLWEQEKTLFWKFVNRTTTLFEGGSEKDAYEFAVDSVEEFVPASSYNMFLLVLSLRAHSPAVQMFYQVSEEAYKMAETSPEEDCGSSPVFVEVNGRLACSMDRVHHLVSENKEASRFLQVHEFDHKFPVWPSSVPLVVLYVELGSSECAIFHSALVHLAQQERIRYIFRHYVKERSSRPLHLSGYGVKLSVKSTEYKAVDDTKVTGEEVHVVLSDEEEEKEVSGFLMATLMSRHPQLKSQLTEFNQHLLLGEREMPELKLWQLQDLGFQATQKIVLAGPDLGLKVTKDIAQNLPTQAKQLHKVQVASSLRKEVLSNQKALSTIGVGPGQCVVLLNGIALRNDEIDIFQLLDVLLSESRLLDDLVRLGVQSSWQLPLLELPMHATQSRNVVVDVRSEHVIFINNLEKDVQYRGWPRSIKEFLRPTFPGMLRQIGKNVFHIVFMLDPVSSEGEELLEYMQLFLEHTVPATLGVLLAPQTDSEVGMAVCQAFAYTVRTLSRRQAFQWLVEAQNMSTSSADVTVTAIQGLYEHLFSEKLSGVSVDEIFNTESRTYCEEARHFYVAKGFGSLPQVLVNGVQVDLEQEELEAAIVTRMHQQTYELQQAIFNNKLRDGDDIYAFFLDRPSVLQRVNKYILTDSTVLDLSRTDVEEGATELSEKTAGALTGSIRYMYLPEGEFTVKRLIVWLVLDLSTAQGRQLLQDALTYVLTTEHVQVGVVHAEASLLAVSVAAASRMQWSMSRVLELVQQLLQIDATQNVDLDLLVGVAENLGLQGSKFRSYIQSEQVIATLDEHVSFCKSVLKMEEGQNAMISNGKVMGPFSDGEEFNLDDWSMLYNRETDQYAGDLVGVVENLQVSGVSPDDDTPSFRSELLMKIASLLRSAPKRQRLSEIPRLANKHSGLHLPARDSDRALTMVAVLDPLSPDTQHLAPVLQVLHAAVSVDMSIYFNPREKLSELPITTFYRYMLEPELSFEEDGSLREDAVVAFSSLPTSPLLTLSLDVPHSWLVEPVLSPYDLDNIHLGAVVEGGVHAEFTLEHILVEGQCFDADLEQPTPGLQFVLGSGGHPDLFDTIVMANLGYFQLKAGPGAWLLRLRPGKSEDIYTVHSYSGKGGRMVEAQDSVVSIDVRSFRGAAVVVRVKKRPGMEKVNLLAGDGQRQDGGEEEQGNIWDTLSSFLQSGGDPGASEGGPIPSTPTNETINIFSIASGHLYERFLRIMMLSVVKHTSNPVKFWFLKNYLSPTFKNFIPHMAAHYGFEVELVEYKWPRWLHAQKEKQRLIWGYKILFLDVLFPLHVKKIIFVDADQIVRVDMRELLEEPLDGAPYAYTPFCDSRPDMKGFRFWDSGYWKNHLGNRRYHISALYVVDLVTFRQMAAGDRLRGQYQALSQDPNSLANLDQDLPNNMIHSVPIKSLPQDWLWCETWCSQESKSRAKTIDLCNNPMTKEPKLDSAMRIVPEWRDYDAEIKTLWEEFRKSNSSTRKETEGEVPSRHVHGEL